MPGTPQTLQVPPPVSVQTILYNTYLQIGSAGGYVRTAFLLEGYGGSSALNDPDSPYGSFDSAIGALSTAYPNEDVTIILQANYGTIYPSIILTTVLTDGGSLTIKSDNSGPWTVTTFDIGNVENVDLRLDSVAVTSLSWDNNNTTVSRNAGTIIGASALIGTLSINGQGPPSTGASGSNGGSFTGSSGSSGADGSPPFAGGTGEEAVANGGNGDSALGNAAWGLTLLGSGTVSQLNGYGIDATGGNGGSGGTAIGGNGGSGGNSTSTTDPENGADGGNGGNASANGGDGGTGTGGSGAQIFRTTGWVITASNIANGEGTGGSGGYSGSATAGSGGSGGSGAMGGSSGNYGSNGSSSTYVGGSGASIPGTAGTITTI